MTSRFELAASMRDNASPGIRKIAGELRRVRVEPGMAQAQKWVRGFNADIAQFKKSSLSVANVMSSMGVGGLAAGASIGALAAQFKKLADQVLDVKELGREIGVTTDQLRAMERAGQHFGFDPSQMEGALKRLAGLMPVFRRGGNNELTQALARAPELMARIRGEAGDTAAVFKDIMGYVGKLQNPQDRIKFYEQIFGAGDLEKLNAEGVGGFDKAVEKARRSLEPMTAAAQAQAQALRDAILDFNTAVERLELKVAPVVFSGLTKAANDFREAFGVIEKAYEWFDKHKDHPIGDAASAAGTAIDKQAEENRKNPPPGMVLNGPGILADAIRILKGQESLTGDAIATQKRYIKGEGVFAYPKNAEEARERLKAYQAEHAGLSGKGDVSSVARSDELEIAIKRMTRFARELDEAATDKLRRAMEGGDNPKPLPNLGISTFHTPSAYDREMRARGNGGNGLDGFVLGALEKPILHLTGTLRTAAAAVGEDGFHQAAFHPTGLISAANMDPQALLASGVKEGMLAAMREWAGGSSSADVSTARSGIIQASFGGGAGGGNPALGGGSFGGEGGSYGNPSKSLLDFIAKSEGGGYNVSWGNGRFLPGGHEQNLTGKTLNEILALGDVMRRQPGARNSSAMGRYQITGSTLRDLMKRMGLSGSEKYDEAMQDRLASKLIADEGPRALQRWEGLKGGGRMSTALGLLRSGQIASQPASGGASGGGFSGDGDAVGIATSMLGFGERQSAQALGHIMHAGEWCADFVNGVIEKSGGKGSGSAMANSFARWGKPVSVNDAKRGDVILENAHGRGINHVGLVESVDHDKLGRAIGIHMISGNYGHMVRRNLEPFGQIQGIRRGNEAVGSDLRAAADQLRDAASDQRQAARVVARTPDWHNPDRPDLDATMRRAGLAGPQSVKVDGGVDAHVTFHDNRHTARVESRGHVRDAGISVRRGPQRTFTV